MKKRHKFGLAALALVLGVGYSMTLPSPPAKEPAATAKANLQLAALTPSARRDIDYAALDARLKRLAQQRSVVGLAVEIGRAHV